MEELKLLIGMVSDLPTMAIWVLLFFFIYKVVIVGSIYSTIKIGMCKLHSWAITPKDKLIDVKGDLDGVIITGEYLKFKSQIIRLPGIRSNSIYNYIHASDIEWLKEAIDSKIEKDKEDVINVKT